MNNFSIEVIEKEVQKDICQKAHRWYSRINRPISFVFVQNRQIRERSIYAMEVSLLNDLPATNSFLYGQGISTCETLYTNFSHSGFPRKKESFSPSCLKAQQTNKLKSDLAVPDPQALTLREEWNETHRGLPRKLLNSYRSKVFQILLRLRPREVIPHSQYPSSNTDVGLRSSLVPVVSIRIGRSFPFLWENQQIAFPCKWHVKNEKEEKTEERKTDRGKEHPVERLVPRNGGEQPGTSSSTAMSETHSIADSNADPI